MPVKFLDTRIFGVQEVKEMLFGGKEAVGHMKPALELVADDLMEVIGINFESQGRRGGGSWQMLSEDWVARKAAANKDTRILFYTHRLFDSMTKRGGEQDLVVNNYRIHFSTYVPYAVVMDEGSEELGIPARPFIKFVRGDLLRWVKICEDYLQTSMKVR